MTTATHPVSRSISHPGQRLTPPVTAGPSGYLRPIENYEVGVPDREVDRQARQRPHGIVTPRADGRHTKCGGLNHCGVCRGEAHHALTHPNRDRLIAYFSEWLTILGISEDQYKKVATLCATLCATPEPADV